MIEDKVVLLTGASEGIGEETARLLATRGASVILASRSQERLEALARSLAHLPGERLAVPTDVSVASHREALIAATMEQFGRVDVLINNAGVGLDAPVEESTLDEARYLFEVNFFAPLHLTQLVLPLMRAQGGGQVVQVSSIVGMRATANIGLYCASKYALNGLADTLRVELEGSNIQVTSIYPGVTRTSFVANQLRTARNKPAAIAVPPERVAQVIVDSIERGSRARYVTWSDFFLVNLARVLPGLAEWALAKGFRWRRRAITQNLTKK
ncbi:MAG: SDR family NAD(P)-dependent oxidoreductase [Ardenticatenales bacterium]|nr:SDR family NAD(P)-dependent oxidoreductase [Ardenticatenales bacterium]